MRRSTINVTTFKLFKKGTTTQIAATVSYNADTDMAKLDPTNLLKEGSSLQSSGHHMGKGCGREPSRPGRLHHEAYSKRGGTSGWTTRDHSTTARSPRAAGDGSSGG